MISKLKEILKVYRKYKLDQINERVLYDKFIKEFETYNALATKDQKAEKESLYPCLYDKTELTDIEPIYFYQDAWAFERIVLTKPEKHIDIGSQHKFVSQLSKVIELTMVDIRPLSLPMNTIKFIKGSILDLPFISETIESISSLCVIEHIGLGRYGDPLDPQGSEKAFKEIDRVLKSGADFYMSVPIEERNKVYFNAHRAFNEDYLLKELLGNYEVLDRKYIYGNDFTKEIKAGWGVGCYHLKKLK